VVGEGSHLELRASTATIVGCVLAAFCEGFDLQAAGVAAQGLVPDLRPTGGELGNFFSASTLGLSIGALIGGRLSDSLGRKGTLITSIALFGVFSILTAAAPDIRLLTGARLLTGLGLGGAFPTLVALVNEHSAPDRRRANVALVYSGMPLGGAFVSLMSMLSAPAHWRSIFLTGGVAPILLVPLMLWAVRESPAFVKITRPEPPRARAASAGPTPHRAHFMEIFAEGRALATLLLWVSCFLGLLTLYLLLSWLPTLLVDSGFTKPQAAGAQIGFNVGGALAAFVLGRLLEGGLRNASILVTFIGTPILVFVLSRGPSDLALVVIVVFALGCGVIAGQGYFYASAAHSYPTSIRGSGAGATVAAGRLGSIVGPKLGGILKAAGHSPAQWFSDILPLVVLGSLTALAFAWRTARADKSHARASGAEII